MLAVKEIQAMCLRYIGSLPLTDDEVEDMLREGMTIDQIYGTACDVYCGFCREVAVEANSK